MAENSFSSGLNLDTSSSEEEIQPSSTIETPSGANTVGDIRLSSDDEMFQCSQVHRLTDDDDLVYDIYL